VTLSDYHGGGDDSRLSWFVAKRWSEIDPEGMFKHLMASGGISHTPVRRDNTQYHFAQELFGEWVKMDPEAAIEAALEADRDADRPVEFGFRAVMWHLIENDLERARKLALEFPVAALTAMGSGYYRVTDIRATMDLFVSLPVSRRQEQAVRSAMLGWIRDSEQKGEAWNWLQGQPAEIQSHVFDQLAESSIESMPTEMLVAMKDHVVENPEFAQEFFSGHSKELIAEFGFVEALRMASESLRGQPRADAMRELLKKTENVKLDHLMTVYDELPGGILRDSTATAIAGRMTEADPVGALEWIDEQELHPTARKEAVTNWAKQWASRNRESILQHLNTTEPSEDGSVLLSPQIS
jgi:hypothetical protein